LTCPVNVSEGRDDERLAALASVCGPCLLDLHRDGDHHRAVLTLGGPMAVVEAAVRDLARVAVAELDLTDHRGAHPRLGVLDVVPFVSVAPTEPASAVEARDRFARWAGDELGLPCFLYGPLPGGHQRTLPEVRRRAFGDLAPDAGPPHPHPTAGACAVGARGVLVAYNLWLEGADLALARQVASSLRQPAVRALGLQLGDEVQVSCNLVDPSRVGPAEVVDRTVALLEGTGARVARCELVGLLPASVLEAVPADRWTELDLAPGSTLEARLYGNAPTTR